MYVTYYVRPQKLDDFPTFGEVEIIIIYYVHPNVRTSAPREYFRIVFQLGGSMRGRFKGPGPVDITNSSWSSITWFILSNAQSGTPVPANQKYCIGPC